MGLHVESHGSGEPLLLLHGWGMHGGVWSGVVPQLAQRFCVHVVDLPGHGHSRAAAVGLDRMVDALSEQFPDPLNVCGWSLGGMVAQRWAIREPGKIKRLILVASTPCFTEREDWLFGMPLDTLQQFSLELEKNHAATLRRFIALQLRGSERERELLQRLREELFSRGEPDLAALRGGLEILRDADLREGLASVRQSALVIAGGRDKLTPPEASYYMAEAMSDAHVMEVGSAAHAPFLSHPEIFVEHVKDFLRG